MIRDPREPNDDVEFTKRLADLPLEVDLIGARELFPRVVPLARRHQLTVYDACYLELAVRSALPLAALDDALRRAAERDGVPLLATTPG